MSEQVKKTPVSIGFLAHVNASRGAPRRYSEIRGPKTGDFSRTAEVRL